MTFNEVFCNTFKAIGQRMEPQTRQRVNFMLPTMTMVQACRANDFELFKPYIKTGVITEAQMHHAAERYYLGKSLSGCPIFWMIDDMLTPLDARIGDTWLSKVLKQRHQILESWNVRHCLFGEHLLHHPTPGPSPYKGGEQSISIVESEHSAVVLSEMFPEGIWLAYVYTCNLTPELLAPLQGRQVTIYPRTDPTMSTYVFFLDYAQLVRQRYNIQLRIDSTLEYHTTTEQKERCIDILDFILES